MGDASERSRGDSNILGVAIRLCEFLETCKYTYFVIGGIAVQRWGEPRQTVDVDVTVIVEFGDEERVAKHVLQSYEARVDEPLRFAVENRVLLVRDRIGVGIDMSLGGLPYESRASQRSSNWTIPSLGVIRTCSAEDLIVMKVFADRPQDWIDVERVIIRQGSRLDRDLILGELAPLVELKEEPELTDRLKKLFAHHQPQ